MSSFESLLKTGDLIPEDSNTPTVEVNKEIDALGLVEWVESDENHSVCLKLDCVPLICIDIDESHVAQQLLEFAFQINKFGWVKVG